MPLDLHLGRVHTGSEKRDRSQTKQQESQGAEARAGKGWGTGYRRHAWWGPRSLQPNEVANAGNDDEGR